MKWEGTLGIASFREGQRECLEHLARHQSVCAIMPTGWGKSLLFWAPARLWGWRILVVSPLIALIEDQAQMLEAKGLRVLRFHGAMTEPCSRADLFSQHWDLILLTPERLCQWEQSGFLFPLKQMINLVVVDEAHCVLEWNFRPALRHMQAAIHGLLASGSLLLAASATLTIAQEEELRALWLGQNSWASVRLKNYLSHVCHRVFPLETENERWLMLIYALKELQGSALIYVTSRKMCEVLVSFLDAAGIGALTFHAGLPARVRLGRVRDFKSGRIPIVVCTSAFGLGIDYPKIRKVIHWGMPYSLPQFWQEVGRAGRDGLPAESLILWTLSDWLAIRSRPLADRQRALELWLYWQEQRCRRRDLVHYFPRASTDACGNCDICLHQYQGKAWWLLERELLVSFLEKQS